MTATPTTIMTPIQRIKGGDSIMLNNRTHEVFDVVPGFNRTLLLKTINADGGILQTRLPRDISVRRVVS